MKKDVLKILKNTLILTLITLIAGLSLSAVYQLTKDPIAKAEAEAALKAYKTVFPEAEFREDETPLMPFDGTAHDIADAEGVTVDKVVAAYRGDQLAGWALTVTSPNGYAGNITIAIGVDTNFVLTGMAVISQGETPGLGAACAEKEFTAQFANIAGGTVLWTKTGKTQPNEIDAISGATRSTRAVTAAVNVGLAYVYEHFMDHPEGGEAQ